MTVLTDHPTERAVAGACLTASTAYRVATLEHDLRRQHFTDPALLEVMRAIAVLADRHDSYDTTMVAGQLAGRSDRYDLIAGLISDACRIRDLPGHITTLQGLERRRRQLAAAKALHDAAVTGDDAHLATAEQLLADREHADDSWAPTQIADAVGSYLQSNDPIGMPTGLGTLDEQIGGGLRPGEMTALGGWTNHGKSPLCDQILTHVARAGHKVHLYINEMNPRDRGIRMVAHAGAAPIDRLVQRRLRDDQERKQVMDALNRLPFGITDIAAWDHSRICRHIRAHRFDLAAVDIVHNIPYKDTGDLDAMIRAFAAAARVAGTHLILVSHFNEERAKSEELPKPVARDLRGSGMLKNACRNVLLLHRYQERTKNELGDDAYELTDRSVVVCDKATHGQRGDVPLIFDGRYMRFRLPDITDRRIHAA